MHVPDAEVEEALSTSGLMVSALYSGLSGPDSSPGLGHNVLCSCARHFTFTVPLSTQEYKWVPANCLGNLTKMLGGLQWTSIPSSPSRGSSDIFQVASCYVNWS